MEIGVEGALHSLAQTDSPSPSETVLETAARIRDDLDLKSPSPPIGYIYNGTSSSLTFSDATNKYPVSPNTGVAIPDAAWPQFESGAATVTIPKFGVYAMPVNLLQQAKNNRTGASVNGAYLGVLQPVPSGIGTRFGVTVISKNERSFLVVITDIYNRPSWLQIARSLVKTAQGQPIYVTLVSDVQGADPVRVTIPTSNANPNNDLQVWTCIPERTTTVTYQTVCMGRPPSPEACNTSTTFTSINLQNGVVTDHTGTLPNIGLMITLLDISGASRPTIADCTAMTTAGCVTTVEECTAHHAVAILRFESKQTLAAALAVDPIPGSSSSSTNSSAILGVCIAILVLLVLIIVATGVMWGVSTVRKGPLKF